MIFFSSSIVAFFLLIWFKSDAYIEYCRLFHLNRISHYKDYEEKKKNDISLTYHGYLRQYHNCFFVQLVTCPICTTVWLSILSGIFFWNFLIIPITFIGGLILFGIIHRLLE